MSKDKNIPDKYIDKIINNNSYASLITKQYKNDHTELEIYCKKHNTKYRQLLKNAMRSNGCPECQKESKSWSTDEFKKRVSLKNPHIEVLGNYTKQGCHVLCRCTIHNIEFSPNSATLLYSKGGCPMCKHDALLTKKISSDAIKLSFNKLNPTMQIIDDNVALNTFVNIHCFICGYNFLKKLTSPYVHNKHCGCPICLNQTIIKGFNDVATVRPDLIKYFKNKDDIYKYGPGMTKKLTFVCPDCKYEKEMKIEVLARQGFGCAYCGDGVSYPNKFVRCFITQLNVSNICFEYSPKWANGYFYDCYFEYNNCKYVIEVDGLQHFKERTGFGLQLQDIKYRDAKKDEFAKNNNHIMIRIDAKKSSSKYLSSQIKNSMFAELFNLDNIDWEKCNVMATSNLAKKVCEYVNKNKPNKYKEICEQFNISYVSAHHYLMQGINYDWCDKNDVDRLSWQKSVNVRDKNNSLLYVFNGIQKCSDEMTRMYNKTYSIHGIHDCCHGIRPDYKEFIFRFTCEDT